jgi:hypothetical protein
MFNGIGALAVTSSLMQAAVDNVEPPTIVTTSIRSDFSLGVDQSVWAEPGTNPDFTSALGFGLLWNPLDISNLSIGGHTITGPGPDIIGPRPGPSRPATKPGDMAIAGSVWIQVAPAIGITVPFGYIPKSDTSCLGLGGGVGGPTSGALAGPAWGGDPQQVLSGWSFSLSGAYGLVGGQLISNSSGTVVGPAFGSKGLSATVSYSWCWQ